TWMRSTATTTGTRSARGVRRPAGEAGRRAALDHRRQLRLDPADPAGRSRHGDLPRPTGDHLPVGHPATPLALTGAGSTATSACTTGSPGTSSATSGATAATWHPTFAY